ncbi:MAG: hypothetical protein KGD58_18370, partial [Candidatus Lokiarchaeota archaeon]|nr:hypothetical protein [Candidatus Lokiarchaeota archaeon]
RKRTYSLRFPTDFQLQYYPATFNSLTSGALLDVVHLCGYKTTSLPFNKDGYFLCKYLLIR